MSFTAKTRKEIKLKSKRQVQQRISKLFLANIFAKLPSILLYCIVFAIICIPAIEPIQTFAAAYNMEAVTLEELMVLSQAVLDAMWEGLLQNLVFCIAIVLLGFLIAAPLNYGMQRLYVAISRDKLVSIVCIFESFSSLSAYWRALKMNLCLRVRAVGWWLLPGAACALMMYRLVDVGAGGDAMNSLFSLVRIIALFIGIKLTIYQMGWIRGLDDASIGAWTATKQASKLMKGHYFHMLIFVFSFLLWSIAQSVLAYYALIGMSGGSVIGAFMLACYVFFAVFISAYKQVSYVGLLDYLSGAPTQEGITE